MEDAEMLVALTADIVAAHVSNNSAVTGQRRVVIKDCRRIDAFIAGVGRRGSEAEPEGTVRSEIARRSLRLPSTTLKGTDQGSSPWLAAI